MLGLSVACLGVCALCEINSEGFLAEVFHPWVRWEGPGSGFENSSGAGAGGAGGWVGPSWAQVGGPTPGPSGWAQAGPKWAQARNLGPPPQKKNLKIQICSAQNVGKVWMSREKIIRAPFGAISGHELGKKHPGTIWGH